MKRYYIEGLFISRKNISQAPPGSRPAPKVIEPFARAFWANDPEEALRLAAEALDGGKWLEPPKVSLTSEEQRMRAAGAPELPGFASSNALPKKKGGTHGK
jgi:hypothetical protein